MGLFNLFSKSDPSPYKKDELNKIYDLLFYDDIELYRSEIQPQVYPFNVLFSDEPDINRLNEITTDKTLDTRYITLAYNLLRTHGSSTNSKVLLGVIVEVSLPNGLDVLAAYNDGTARYINHSGKLLVWDTQTDKSNELIKQLLSDSLNVVNNIGPWDKKRRPFPAKGMIRLTFLVSNGLYFGEAPSEVFHKDPMAAPVINAAYMLMQYLISNIQTK